MKIAQSISELNVELQQLTVAESISALNIELSDADILKEVSTTFSANATYTRKGEKVSVEFTATPTYSVVTTDFGDPILYVKRATTSLVDDLKAATEFEKRKAIIETLDSLSGSAGPCTGITGSTAIKRVTATVTDIVRNVSPFLTKLNYNAVATFTPSIDTQQFLREQLSLSFSGHPVYDGISTIVSKPTVSFSGSSQYAGFTATRSKRVRRFILATPTYSITSNKFDTVSETFTATPIYNGLTTFFPQQISETFSGSASYSIESTELTSVSNTFSTSVSYDTFLESGSKKVSETFSGSAQYAGESITTLVELSDTFTATPSYAVETISIFKQVAETFSGFVNYSITSDQPQTVSNTFTTTPQYGGETTSEFAEVANTVSGIAQYAGETISIFQQVANTFSGSATYDLEKTTDTTQVSSTFSGVGIYGTKDITQLDYTATATFTSSTQQTKVTTEYLRPDEDVSTGFWDTNDQGFPAYEKIDEVTPNDSDYIRSTQQPSNQGATFGLSSGTFTIVGQRVNHVLRLRHQTTSGVGSVNLTVELYTGISLVKQVSYTNLRQSVQQREILLTVSEANQLDYTDLNVKFIANTNDGSSKEVRVTWVELEVPNVEV